MARWDEEGRVIAQDVTVPRNLETLSVKAMEEYILLLEAEIVRARAEITKRGSAKAAADAVFGKKV